MCQPRMNQQPMSMASCNCGCCGCGPTFRGFFSTREELDRLKSYKDQLEKEIAGVQQRINEVKES